MKHSSDTVETRALIHLHNKKLARFLITVRITLDFFLILYVNKYHTDGQSFKLNLFQSEVTKVTLNNNVYEYTRMS